MADGMGCKCAAWSENECSCVEVDWTSQREIDLRAENERLKANLERHMEVIVKGREANEALQKELAALKASEPVAITCAALTPGDVGYIRTLVNLPLEAKLFATPQPASEDARDAARYRELIYAVRSKYPDESCHETALRYIRQAEESKCRAVKGGA